VHDLFRAAGRVVQDQSKASDAGQSGYSPQKFGIKHKENNYEEATDKMPEKMSDDKMKDMAPDDKVKK
jgi:hypothetical protein